MTLHERIFVNSQLIVMGVDLWSLAHQSRCSRCLPYLKSFFSVMTILWINLNWNSFSLFSLHVFEATLKTSVQFSVSIEISLSLLSGPVWGNWWFLTRSIGDNSLLPYTFQNWFDYFRSVKKISSFLCIFPRILAQELHSRFDRTGESLCCNDI